MVVREIINMLEDVKRLEEKLKELKIAKEHNIPFKLFPANWDLYGKRAGYLRNVEMGKYCKAALIFWDGESKGTQHMMNILKAKNKKFVTIKYGG